MGKKLLILLFAFSLASCGSIKSERQVGRVIRGEWQMKDITYPGSTGFVDVNLFKTGSTKCFRNSIWRFVFNNYKGNFSLNENCGEENRNFVWDVLDLKEDGLFDFTLKVLDGNTSARKTKEGFRLSLVYLSENEMIWEQKVQFEGKPFTIRMNFEKINNKNQKNEE